MRENRRFVAVCPWTAAKLTCLHEGHIASLWKLQPALDGFSLYSAEKYAAQFNPLPTRLPGSVTQNRQLKENNSC